MAATVFGNLCTFLHTRLRLSSSESVASSVPANGCCWSAPGICVLFASNTCCSDALLSRARLIKGCSRTFQTTLIGKRMCFTPHSNEGLFYTAQDSHSTLSYCVSLAISKRLLSDRVSTCSQRRRVPFLISCLAAHKPKAGRVGTHERQGNVSIASFGIKSRKCLGIKNGDFTKAVSGLLPYVVVATAVAALVHPSTFAWVTQEYYAPALGGIMLSIGVQLSLKDFALALQRPKAVLAGYFAQYGVKPFLGVLVARAFHVPAVFASGFILTACVAGAQLSSYASYLSEGDVALSIVLTSLSTITSVLATPALTGLLIGAVVPVNAIAMAKSILQVVLCPVMAGLVLNTYAKPVVDVVRPLMPLMAMICTSMCIGSPLALNKKQIATVQGLQLLGPVLFFHIAAFTFGYWVSKLPALRLDEKASRTLSLCTGMQSSTLAGLLASQFLGGSQTVPPACSVVVMAVMGLTLASYWGNGHRFRDVLKRWRGGCQLGPSDASIQALDSLRWIY